MGGGGHPKEANVACAANQHSVVVGFLKNYSQEVADCSQCPPPTLGASCGSLALQLSSKGEKRTKRRRWGWGGGTHLGERVNGTEGVGISSGESHQSIHPLIIKKMHTAPVLPHGQVVQLDCAFLKTSFQTRLPKHHTEA